MQNTLSIIALILSVVSLGVSLYVLLRPSTDIQTEASSKPKAERGELHLAWLLEGQAADNLGQMRSMYWKGKEIKACSPLYEGLEYTFSPDEAFKFFSKEQAELNMKSRSFQHCYTPVEHMWCST